MPSPGRLRAVITDDRFGSIDEERAVFDPLGVDIVVASCATSDDVARACADADAVLANLAPIDARALAAMRRCRVVSRYGVGLDSVDVAACAARGIAVANVSGYCDAEVAEHALALVLSLTRGIPERDEAVRGGLWNIGTLQLSIRGSTIGVAGFGGSGRAFARAVLGLGPSRVLLWSPHLDQSTVDRELAPGATLFGAQAVAVSFERLLAESDILSVHLRLEPASAGLFGQREFASMKRGALFVNTARGGLVDSTALAAALRTGQLSGAGIDVLDQEPPAPDHPLLFAPHLLLTDHCAYRSVRSVAELKRRCAENAARALGLLPPA